MTRAPFVAEWLMRASLAENDREVVLGDAHEEFADRSIRQGASAARRWYWSQTVRSLAPNLRRRIAARRRPMNPQPTKGLVMNSLWQDIRFGVRNLARRPGVTIVAVLSLTVGITAATIVFSLLDAAVLRALPVTDPSRLALVLEQRDTSVNRNFSYNDFTSFRDNAHAFTNMFAYERVQATVRDASGSRVVPGELVTSGYFSTLGVKLLMGRGLSDVDAGSGAQPAVVVTMGFWRRLFGDAPFAAHTVLLNGTEFAIVGVAARPFQGMVIGREAQFWAPLVYQPVLDPDGNRNYLTMTGVSWLTIIGRLRPAVTMAQAATDLNQVEAQLPRTPNRPQVRRLLAQPGDQGDSMLPTAMASPLTLLLAAAGLVLLIACANVANLMVSRTRDRAREIAIRTALGAGRRQIARLLFSEALLLGLSSAGLALITSLWAARLAVPLLGSFGTSPALDVSINWRVLLFAVSLGFAATLISVVMPISVGVRLTPSRSLGDAGRGATRGPASQRLRQTLIVAQFTLSLALVMSAALLVRTVANLRAIPTGFDIDHVALLSVDPTKAQYDLARIQRYFSDATDRLARVPGVRAAAYGRVIPIGFGGSRTTIEIPGYRPRPGEDMEINFNVVSPTYFDATGITLIAGREFTDRDISGTPLVAIVNETMAKRYWPSGSAIDSEFRFGGGNAPGFRVVGIARDVKYRMLREEAAPSFYYPIAQSDTPRGGVLHVRTAGDPTSMLEALRRAAADIDPAVPVTNVNTLRQQADINATNERLAMTIGVSLGAAALLLAAVGLYGALAYAVLQRRREIGVRLALGALPLEVRRLILRQAMKFAIIGSGLGLALAIAAGHLIETRLYGVTPYDAISAAVSVALLVAVSLFASWTPARRASRVDPVETLRVE